MRTLLAVVAGVLSMLALLLALTFAGANSGPVEVLLAGVLGFPLGFFGVSGSRHVARLTEPQRGGPHGAH